MSILKNPTARILSNSIKKEKEYKALSDSFRKFSIKNYKQPPAYVTGLSGTPLYALVASLIELLYEQAKDFSGTSLVVVPDEKSAAYAKEVMSAMLDGVYIFPMRDFVFQNVEAFSREWEYERLDVLRKIYDGSAKVVIAVPEAALSILPPADNIGGSIKLSVGETVGINELLEKLCLYGYTEADTVEGKGQFSHRGDIVDIFPPSTDYPLRVEFFGDEIDACGFFDVMTQRRTENIDEFTITPSREILLSDSQKALCLEKLSELIKSCEKRLSKAKKDGEKLDVLTHEGTLEKLKREYEGLENATLACIDKYLPLINPEGSCLLSYIKGGIFVTDTQKCSERIKSTVWQLNENILALISAGELSPDCVDFMKGEEYLASLLLKKPSLITSNFTANANTEISGLYSFISKQTSGFAKNLEIMKDDLESYNSSGYITILMSRTKKSATELCRLLGDGGIKSVVTPPEGVENLDTEGGVCYCVYDEGISPEIRGFELTKAGVALLTDSDRFSASQTVTKKTKKTKSSGQKILSYQDLKIGDFVVHSVHGIARYEGIKTLTVDGVTKDYIMLQYAGSDALYIPVGQLDRVSRYAGAGESVRLSSMSSKEWQKTKIKAKKAAKDMAKQLIDLYARRMRLEGYAFSPDTEWQKDFEDDFEFEETEGQIDAISEIKADMESPHPMDRLLCGDVGFGKTEVALRAVFKAVIEGKQAAILVPTTILALQHYQTVLSRMKGFPFKIEMLSRFVKPKEAKEVVKRLSTGETDIVIGTHKLLGKDIKFRDLGLLVVDEEQRFGVAHKERLKEISKNIDVLTLTATPIPRTLNMAMAGIRDMSVLEEAPTNRYPVQTYVIEHDDFIITEAIKKELRRAGQVFYLHNRVEGIEETAARLREALPDANIAVAHGKMDREELSDIWASVINGETDILVCTTIIETGIDVPNANTLIIEDADKLGLSQLHQIRGRIGRSGRKAYAYITWRKSGSLTEVATKRLEALREFTEFGSGFKIAMRDLEIRGAGNLLGAEQSGHMEAVGYDLYIRILEEAVLEEKGISPKKEKESSVDFGVNAYIPEKYIRLPGGRIEMYKKIAAAENKADTDEIVDELIDRYGEPPREVMALISISLIRQGCDRCGIKKIEHRENKLVIYPERVTKATSVSLAVYFKGRLLLSMGQNPCYNIKLLKDENPLTLAKDFVEQYEKLLAIEEKRQQNTE